MSDHTSTTEEDENKSIATETSARMEEIVNGVTNRRSENRVIYVHQVIVRHRSPVLAEKIRKEERRRERSMRGKGGSTKNGTITILMPDLDFQVALVLLEFMYTDDVFTRLLPGEKLVRDVMAAANEYGLPRLRSICQSVR